MTGSDPAGRTGRLPVGYAHRGFAPDGAENTMGAFQAAIGLGFDHLETDVRVTSDGVAVLFHDPVLDRLTNHTGPLRRLSWRQLSQARVLGGEPIPRLTDLLASFGDAFVNLDLKVDEAIGPTLDAIRQTGAAGRVRLATFSHSRLLTARGAAGPTVASALSPAEVAALLAGRTGRLPLGHPGGLAAQVPAQLGRFGLTERLLRQAHRHGIEVHAWTVNDSAQLRWLLELGVDAIITDRLDLLRTVLIERRQWPGGPARPG
ncbi:MAG TPA: glycerophosphodiester phosphodiesterase family protein [Jatrophihabitans sp.]|nr:glycerophosphodiester phosphodiesterase family protein [Jatrophihabitans sp.]